MVFLSQTGQAVRYSVHKLIVQLSPKKRFRYMKNIQLNISVSLLKRCNPSSESGPSYICTVDKVSQALNLQNKHVMVGHFIYACNFTFQIHILLQFEALLSFYMSVITRASSNQKRIIIIYPLAIHLHFIHCRRILLPTLLPLL